MHVLVATIIGKLVHIVVKKNARDIVYEECATLPSERARSTTASLMMGLAGRLTEREPRRHIVAE